MKYSNVYQFFGFDIKLDNVCKT